MKGYFLDTNVVIDFLAHRKPFAEHAAALFDAALAGKVKLYIGAISFNNIYYVLRKVIGHEKTLNLLDRLMEFVDVADVTGLILKRAISSKFRGFEDAIQYEAALTLVEIDAIVTRNGKDFKNSELPLFNPREALAAL